MLGRQAGCWVSWVRGVGALLLVVLAAACDTEPPQGPRTIILEADRCARCNQPIHSLDAAAEAVNGDGTVRTYDDLGCMATDPVLREGAWQLFVQFAGGRGWVRVDDAHFARQPDRQSAHGYSLFAYTEDEARRLDIDHWARGWSDIVAELNRTK